MTSVGVPCVLPEVPILILVWKGNGIVRNSYGCEGSDLLAKS